MFVQTAQNLLGEGGMRKDIIMMSIWDFPILTSNANQEAGYMPSKTNLTAIILPLRLPPNLRDLSICLKTMQMNLHLNHLIIAVSCKKIKKTGCDHG